MNKNWTTQDIPDQTGKVAIVTGANSGLGYEASLELARKNATVVMACRNLQKGAAARDNILQQVPGARLEVMKLDLSSLAQVRDFAEAFKARYDRLDILLNNAGVMAPPRSETADGFELQFGVNHLGHFALTGHLLDRLVATENSRVVSVSSNAQFFGRVNFDDLQSQKRYSRYEVYSMTKLANVLFAFELQRRLQAAGASTLSIPAHPGLSDTSLQANTAASTGNVLEKYGYPLIKALIGHSQPAGTLPLLYAATAPDVQPGDHIGVRWAHVRGYPRKVKAAKAAYDAASARRLWELSEELTGVTYALAAAQPASVGSV